MRALPLLLSVAVACGGGGTNDGDGGGGDDDGSTDGDGGPTVDGPPPTATLPERITVATITTPAGVMAGVSNWRIWGTSSLRVAPDPSSVLVQEVVGEQRDVVLALP